MAASFRLILTRFGLPDKPEAPIRIANGRPTGPTPCPEPRHVEFSLIETRLSCEFEPTHDNRTPYAVEVTGGGRNSAMSRKMSAKRIFGMATSAI